MPDESLVCRRCCRLSGSCNNAPESSSHHIYMSLIVLLILSEDELFNRSVHATVSAGLTAALMYRLEWRQRLVVIAGARERWLIRYDAGGAERAVWWGLHAVLAVAECV